MPPKPLSHQPGPLHLEMDSLGTYPFVQRPHLAVLAMERIASWATVESWLLKLYVDLSGGNKSMAADIFLALEGNAAKSAAITKLIARIEPRYQTLYLAISKMAKTRSKERDKLAHWIWGISPQYIDALLLADPRSEVRKTLDFEETRDLTMDEIFKQNLEGIYIYDSIAFREMLKGNTDLASYIFRFRWLRIPIHNPNDKLYHELCAEPAIREILDRQARQG